MGSLKSLDTQKGLMFLHWGGDESLSRSGSETITGGGAQLWTGERQQREGTPPSQVTTSHLLPDAAASHPWRWIAPRRQKTYCTAPNCNPTGLLFWWQMFGVKSHCVQKKIFTKASCSHVLTDTFVCWGTIEISNQVEWCIKYEWIGLNVFTNLWTDNYTKRKRSIVLAFTFIFLIFTGS